MASPSELLNAPQSDFVADFIGRDRGYRKLSFYNSGPLASMQTEPTAEVGTPIDMARNIAVQRWLLVTHEGKACGWFDTHQQVEAVVPEHINLGATFFPQTGTLRQMLDSALSSPCHRAVVIGERAEVLGTLGLDHVLDACKSMAREAV
jgi:osmoprotectant transport system ATP-binding protein